MIVVSSVFNGDVSVGGAWVGGRGGVGGGGSASNGAGGIGSGV